MANTKQTSVEHTEGNQEGETRETGHATYAPGGKIRDRYEPGSQDFGYVSPERLKRYGVDPNTHQYGWARNPAHWNTPEREGTDRVEQIQDALPGAHVVHNASADYVRNGDLILMAIPMPYIEEKKRYDDYAAAEYNKPFEDSPEEPDGMYAHTDLFDRDAKKLNHEARQDHKRNVSEGIIGPSSQYRTISEGYAAELRGLMRRGFSEAQAKERIKDDMADIRSQGRHKDLTDNDWSRIMGGPEAARAERRDTEAKRAKSITGADVGNVKSTRDRVRANLGKDK